MILTLFFILSFVLTGAFVSRWHGGGFKIPASKSLKNFIWAVPFGVLSFLVSDSIAWGCLALVLCLVGKATGHGRVWNAYLPLDETKKREKFEIPFTWLKGGVSDFTYKNVVMALIGFGAVCGASFVFMGVNIWAGLLIAIGGALGKPAGYLIGWKVHPSEGNAVGEYLTGAFAYGFLSISFIMVN